MIVLLYPPTMLIIRVPDQNLPVIGIAFNLVLIRVGQKRAESLKELEEQPFTHVPELQFHHSLSVNVD